MVLIKVRLSSISTVLHARDTLFETIQHICMTDEFVEIVFTPTDFVTELSLSALCEYV